MTTFLTGMERAVQGHGESLDRVLRTLDLDEINSLVRREKGRDLAWMLLDVLEKSGGVAPAKISARTSGKPYTVRKFPEGSIIISPKPDGRWLFASDSLRLLPEILDGLTARNASDKASHLPWHLQFRGKLPDVLKQKWVVLEHWQWLGILLIITVG
ncbi:MAG: mechanosensitive ion channel family protein, partial [Pseudomonadota bacterium]